MEKKRTDVFCRLKIWTAGIAIALWVLAAIALISALVWLYFASRDNRLEIGPDNAIDITPAQIRSIENIGEWEFLSIADEELVDTARHGFFGDDELVRIYYGTLRLGINLHEARPGWLSTQGDSIVAILPPVKLLDNDFIDETRSKSFFESGKWSQADRAALYDKAYRSMKNRCLNGKNMESARQNAMVQFTNLLRSMGFNAVSVRFEEK